MGGTDKKPRIKKNGSSAVPAGAPDDAGAVKVGKPKRGRPSGYSDELAQVICNRLAGGESLEEICKEGDMPCSATVRLWKIKIPGFLAMYAQAREEIGDAAGLSVLAKSRQMDAIAQGILAGKITPEVGRAAIDALNRTCDQIKWSSGRMATKKWGDKVELGGDINVTTMRLYGKDAPIDKV